MSPASPAVAHLVVVQDVKDDDDNKFEAAVERVRDMRRDDAEADLMSPEHERRVRGRRDLLKLLEESKERLLLAASSDVERRAIITAHAANVATLEELVMTHQKTVTEAISAAVDAALLPAARLYDSEPYIASPRFMRLVGELNQRCLRELDAPLSRTRIAAALFRAYADVLSAAGHTHASDVEAAANMVGDRSLLEGDRDVTTWRSHGGYKHNISPQTFIFESIDYLTSDGGNAGTGTWHFRESFACIHEFVQRVKREDFGGSALRVSHFGPGAEDKQRAASEQEAVRAQLSKQRARRAKVIRAHVVEAELLAALKNLETIEAKRGA